MGVPGRATSFGSLGPAIYQHAVPEPSLEHTATERTDSGLTPLSRGVLARAVPERATSLRALERAAPNRVRTRDCAASVFQEM